MGRRSHKVKDQYNGGKNNGKGTGSFDPHSLNLPRGWDYYERFKDPFILPFQTHTINIKQSSKGPRVGSTVWDSSIVMSKYFELEVGSKLLKNKRVIELGAGVGLLGITLSLLESDIVLTDQKCMHDILHYNVRHNCSMTKTKVDELWWGDDVSKFHPPYDMIVGSDLMYEDDCVDLLLASLLDLSSFHPKKKQQDLDETFSSITLNDKKQQNDSSDDEDDNNKEKEEDGDDEEEEEEIDGDDLVNENDIQVAEKRADDAEPLYIKSAQLQPADTVIYLGYEHRQMTAESIFMNKVTTYFDVETITTRHLHPGFEHTDIRILRMTRKGVVKKIKKNKDDIL
ncbi:hypothetical protein PPL_06683 [Heterostelium album PN500]|uniref:Uncharacterized protein n=1 Tax=Heterostelium pallidum (strain ATCC 26659 / Pp 5 / PN500) TaxID=670386 RepID=D3BFE9_HETP5|nr:hypothetical protein PPL_06683 [Heterostelium album PN500]EFA79863.1 hypothetical protein PPL_06683 [Heterostelium album PN500]|eukprot:XP_020431984.1 hypothetical protein PPL_06683 [Heterostelium album PN500]